MNEIADFVKELLLIKEEKASFIGLTSFKKPQKKLTPNNTKKQSKKELSLSDLMRRA